MAGTSDTMTYYFLGQNVCRSAFARLYGASWSPRLSGILKSVFNGDASCPLDRRFKGMKETQTKSSKWGEVWTYLQSVYDSIAETLPEDDDQDIVFSSDGINDACDVDDVSISAAGDPDIMEPNSEYEIRRLPPGSIYEQWRQYKEVGNEGSYSLFWSVWNSDFWFMKFRGKRAHSQCPICLKHKLLIREFSHDTKSRVKQRHLYDLHLKSQYCDRKHYWHLRSEARLYRKIIVFVIDAMDQGKFAYPRDPSFASKFFDGFQRPRAHVYGLIAHGVFTLLSVSAADAFKGGSTTCELIAHALTLLSNQCDIHEYEVHVLMDNAGSANKNNTVFMFLGFLVLCGLVRSTFALFLRVGHTHEDMRSSCSMSNCCRCNNSRDVQGP